jgi:hypothetical protein
VSPVSRKSFVLRSGSSSSPGGSVHAPFSLTSSFSLPLDCLCALHPAFPRLVKLSAPDPASPRAHPLPSTDGAVAPPGAAILAPSLAATNTLYINHFSTSWMFFSGLNTKPVLVGDELGCNSGVEAILQWIRVLSGSRARAGTS